MTKYDFNLTIEAKTSTDAEEKVKALTTLASKLSAKELTKLAHIVQNDPAKTMLAKRYMGL